jgi:membrane-bound metal-dependent hydrolase YbcI (DUF457 family)
MTTTLLVVALVLVALVVLRSISRAFALLMRLALLAITLVLLWRLLVPGDGGPPATAPPSAPSRNSSGAMFPTRQVPLR